ncbi:hypothetical protein WUBG_03616 [Wuchereria bancrofti]|nr:hypothetical protein WUBG_03616 [Wuchereria bancrofti]
MALSRFSLLFLRRALNVRISGAQWQKIRLTNIVKKRFYSTEVAPNVSACGLDLLITNLTQERSVKEAEISTVTSVEGLRKVCAKLEGPISGEISVRILTRFAELANESVSIQKAAAYLKK